MSRRGDMWQGWATVTATSPLKVARAGEVDEAYASGDLHGALAVGDKVWVLRDGRQVIVVGKHHPLATRTWKAWTPAFLASTTNPTHGNSTRAGRYRVADDGTVDFTGKITIGSTFSGGSGNYSFAIPVDANVDDVEWAVQFHITSAALAVSGIGELIGGGKIESPGDSVNRLYYRDNASTTTRRVSSSTAWATGDRIVVSGSYEAAPA